MKIIKKLLVIFLILIITLFLGLYGIMYSITRDNHKPYMNLIEKYSEQYDIDKNLVLAIVKTESSFNKKAKSSVGAEGLMQIMPETAKWIAGKLKEEYRPENIYDPELNIRYGTFYLNYLINYFKSEDYAIIAYNAGMGNVKKWIRDGIFKENDNYKNIPNDEPRNYIKKVKEQYRLNKKIYAVYYADLESGRAKRAFNTLITLIKSIFK